MARLAGMLHLDDLPPHLHPQSPADIPPEQREAEYQQLLQKLLGHLSEQERELLLDKIEHGRSDNEIAQHLGITVNAVRIRWMRLKEHITQILKNKMEKN